MYSYKFTKQVEKFLEKQSKDFLLNFKEKLNILKENPFNNSLDIKNLK
jgi:mRNA-degrading endonuclease RelE of RelBE toxin-antitoxin system